MKVMGEVELNTSENPTIGRFECVWLPAIIFAVQMRFAGQRTLAPSDAPGWIMEPLWLSMKGFTHVLTCASQSSKARLSECGA